jgi:hypothetical protein
MKRKKYILLIMVIKINKNNLILDEYRIYIVSCFVFFTIIFFWFTNFKVYEIYNPVSVNMLNYIFLGGCIIGVFLGLGIGIFALIRQIQSNGVKNE